MSVELTTIFGSPNIGVYIYANNKLAILPHDIPQKLERQVREVLGVETLQVSIAGSRLLGVFIAGNDNGLILPRVATDWEIEAITKAARQHGINVTILREVKETGLGNLILSNDRGCLVSNLLKKVVGEVSDGLGLDCITGSIAGSVLVGSLAVVTNTGLALPPLVSEEELAELSRIFKVPANVVTVNRGRFFLRSGLVANDKGALVGDETTGIELMQLQRTFFH